MLRGIDHLVVVVPDLAAAAKSYAALGFSVVPGGRHPVGTHNQLIAFADGSYIELIAFYEKTAEHKWWGPLQRGGGLVDFCMQTDDLLADTAALRPAGVAIYYPSPPFRRPPRGGTPRRGGGGRPAAPGGGGPGPRRGRAAGTPASSASRGARSSGT